MSVGAAYGRTMEASSSPILTRVAYGSLAVGLVVLALKGYAAYATGSIALFSDALESIVNVVTSIVALVAVRLRIARRMRACPMGTTRPSISRR